MFTAAWAHALHAEVLPSQGWLVKAFLGCALLSLSSGPLGVFLVLRRATLIGDALSHGLLPGVALGFLIWGASPLAMSFTGMLAGIALACLATWLSKASRLPEDSTFAGLYLFALSIGFLLLGGHQDHLLHALFGALESLNASSLLIIGLASGVTLGFFALFYRPFVIYCFDPLFFTYKGGKPRFLGTAFAFILSLNLMASFHALGTLMSLGLMVLPALIMRLVTLDLKVMCVGASALALSASFLGLALASKAPHLAGSTIICLLGGCYMITLGYVSWRKNRPS